MKVLFPFRCVGLVERLGLMQLASVLRRAGHEPVLVNVLGLRTTEIIRRVLDIKPSLIAYTSNTGEHLPMLALAREIRKHWNGPVVFGGPHATFFPEVALDSCVDAACRGEGEGAILDIVNCIEEQRSFTEISNLWTSNDGILIRNPVRPLITDLDALPWPDRDSYYKAEPAMRDIPTKMFMATRGCPHICTYCYNHAYNELYNGCRKITHRSAENFLEEIKEVKSRWRLEQVLIFDDCFLTKPSAWHDTFADKYPREVGLPIIIQVRPDVVTAERAKMLAATGVKIAALGVETATEEIRYSLLNRKVSDECILNAANELHKAGIKIISLSLIGLPLKDSYKEAIFTLRMNRKIRPYYANSFIYTPYPRTILAEKAWKNGFLKNLNPDNIPQTDKIASVLTFSHSGEKEMIERLHKIFDIAVQIPVPEIIINILCKMPLNKIYNMIYLIWYGFKWHFRFVRSKKRLSDITVLLRHFVKYVRGVL